ncbi:MAG: hypothetical protein U0K68_14460 [Agathobacter sp.]|nr:hypothetical protein [Agathobacter sp.]
MINIYLVGMIIAMISFLGIGMIVSRKVKNAEDFYVAGRQAPVLLPVLIIMTLEAFKSWLPAFFMFKNSFIFFENT